MRFSVISDCHNQNLCLEFLASQIKALYHWKSKTYGEPSPIYNGTDYYVPVSVDTPHQSSFISTQTINLKIKYDKKEHVNNVQGRLLVLFPGEYENNNYRLLDARPGWNYQAVPITANQSL